MTENRKPKDTKGILLRLGKYVIKEWPLFISAIIFTLLSNQLSLLGPKYSGAAIDAITLSGGNDLPAVFENVIRSMSPDTVITDEIFFNDMQCISACIESGIAVAASVHSENIAQAKGKLGHGIGVFDRYVVIGRDKQIAETGCIRDIIR